MIAGTGAFGEPNAVCGVIVTATVAPFAVRTVQLEPDSLTIVARVARSALLAVLPAAPEAPAAGATAAPVDDDDTPDAPAAVAVDEPLDRVARTVIPSAIATTDNAQATRATELRAMKLRSLPSTAGGSDGSQSAVGPASIGSICSSIGAACSSHV